MKKYDSDKIKAMSIQERKDWINAIDELVIQYKNNDNGGKCPLCITMKLYKDDEDRSCGDCPWLIFEGMDCMEFTNNNMPICNKGELILITQEKWNKWKRIRYPMLRCWKRIIERGF